jgi:apolipoprotein N-acyltransferase
MITRIVGCCLTAALLLAGAIRVHGGLAWLVAAPFVVLRCRDLGWGAAIAFGAAFGAAAGASTQTGWLAETAQRYFQAAPATAWMAASLLTVSVCAVQGAVLAAGVRCALSRRGLWAVASGGAVWAVWDRALPEIFPYYPWPSLAAAQVDVPLALPAVGVLSSVGLTALTAAAGIALGFVLVSTDARERLRYGITYIACIAAVAGAGASVRTGHPAGTGDPRCDIEAIDAHTLGPALESYRAATTLSATTWARKPSVVVWPESTLPASPVIDSRLRRNLEELSMSLAVPLVAGGPRLAWDARWSQRRFNSAFRIEAGHAIEAYDKRRLVPFAEYWPLPWIDPPPWMDSSHVARGAAPGLFDAGGCVLGILICFEAQDPRLARDLARAGADALLILTNDANVGPGGFEMEARQARLRAAETGLAVLRAANAGRSFAAFGDGAVQSAEGGVTRVSVPAPHPAAAVSLAPWVLGLCLAVSAATLAGALLGPRATRRRGSRVRRRES